MSSDPNKKIKIVFTCLDWRLHPQVENFFTQEGDGCDMCVTAGSIKSLIDPATQDYMLNQIEISKNLHNCQSVVLTMHMDCGAYGGSKSYAGPQAELDACKKELAAAKTIVKKHYFELQVETWILNLDRSISGWNVRADKVEVG